VFQSRRDFLCQNAWGFGGLALAAMLQENEAVAAGSTPHGGALQVLHHPPRAKRVVQLFMAGAASHIDLWDHKPALEKHHGEPSDFGEHVEAFQNGLGPWMKSPFRFAPAGESGKSISDAVARHVRRYGRVRTARIGVIRYGIPLPETRTALPAPDETPAERRARFLRRRSHRTYSLRPLSLEAFGRLLDALSREEVEGGPKYLYASPGGLYPTQTYLHVWPGRVEGVAGGTYYYDPTGHELVVLEEGASISKEIHVPFVNQPIFAEAAFSVFLVTQMDAIGPAYGSYSLRFATLEAGVMAHQLEAAAAGTEVGLCQIGSVEFGRIRHLFHLDDSHVLVHSLVGGRVAESGADEAPRTGGGRAERIQRLAQKVDELSDEEVEALLRAERGERDAE